MKMIIVPSVHMSNIDDPKMFNLKPDFEGEDNDRL
jgi:hypothetical protein